MKRWGRSLIGLLVAMALTSAVAALSWPRLATVRQGQSNVPAGELVGGREFGQTFRAPFSGLYRVNVFLATYARTNHGPLRFHLYDGLEGTRLVTLEVDAAQIADNAFRSFIFDPIEGSAGQEFFFALEAQEAAPGNAVTVWMTDYNAYLGGQAYTERHPVAGDLTFVAYYRSDLLEVLRFFSEQVRLLNPALWRVRWLVVGLTAGWLVGLGVLMAQLIPAGEREK